MRRLIFLRRRKGFAEFLIKRRLKTNCRFSDDVLILSELLELINRQLTEKKNLKIEKASTAVIDATLHRKFRYARAAYFGLIKVSAQSHLKAMCLNLLKAANRLSVPVAA